MANESNLHRVLSLSGLSVALLAGSVASADEFDPPASYYSGATGTGATLKAQLTVAMSAGHIQRDYGDFRASARLTDTDPNNPSNILLAYNRASVGGFWDNGSTWNREHVWPQSRQPGSASNSTKGNLGDPHALRPCNPSINGSRSNDPFGFVFSTGGYQSFGSFFFPGDSDKGDIARSLFYSATRYASSGLQLVNGTPSGNQMGELNSLVAWHFIDSPDTFERRRNHAVYSPDLNEFWFTNNRNAYVDRPEFVWSVFVDQENDSQLRVAPAAADGGSTLDLDISTIVGIVPDAVSFDITKSGDDGTYYSVEASSMLETSVSGRHNAFAIGSDGLSVPVEVSVDASAVAVSGAFSETVTVDNLDVTTQGGVGVGDNDADDVVNVDVNVYGMFEPSFESGSSAAMLSVDLGQVELGGGDGSMVVDVFNVGAGGFVAPFDVTELISSGDTAAISLDLSGASVVDPSMPGSIVATLDDAALGSFDATFTLEAVAAVSVFGSITAPTFPLTLEVSGVVVEDVCPADFASPFGSLDFADVSAFLSVFAAGDPSADLDDSGMIDFGDVSAFLSSFSAGCP